MPLSITIVALGKKNAMLDEETGRYAGLLRPYCSIRIVMAKPPAASDAPRQERREREGKLLQSKWPAGSYPVALSEEGRLMNSLQFSQWLDGLRMRHYRPVFTIGGAYGLPPFLKRACKEVISLSPLTLPHKLCMVVLVEQLYRAFTILHHHPYSK